jgi:plasmid stabilization system protein ParE
VARRIVFRPEAEADAIETRDWYEARRSGLGLEFNAELERTIDRIQERPLSFQRVRGDTRRAVLDRFPYSVYFRLLEDDVVVVAVHGRQHPRRWQSRR